MNFLYLYIHICMYKCVCILIYFLIISAFNFGDNNLLDLFRYCYWKRRCLIRMVMDVCINIVNANDVKVILLMFLWIIGTGTALITENHRKMGLTIVPENLNTDVEVLILKINNIHSITNRSLANYPSLVTLNMENNVLNYIYEGAFDSNANLQYLYLKNNMLRYIPADFGPAKYSLLVVNLYAGMEIELTNMNFSQFSVLQELHIGGNPMERVDASNLPKDIQQFILSNSVLTVMPSFFPYTPGIRVIKLGNNNIAHISAGSVTGLQQLTSFRIQRNQVETIPDMYHQPLETLTIDGNPLVCNQSLCWVRMWTMVKAIDLFGIDRAICHSPSYLAGKTLLDVDPVAMACYLGWYDL